jgi:hypothetical protein
MMTKTILVAIKFGCEPWMETKKGEYNKSFFGCISHPKRIGNLKTIVAVQPS